MGLRGDHRGRGGRRAARPAELRGARPVPLGREARSLLRGAPPDRPGDSSALGSALADRARRVAARRLRRGGAARRPLPPLPARRPAALGSPRRDSAPGLLRRGRRDRRCALRRRRHAQPARDPGRARRLSGIPPRPRVGARFEGRSDGTRRPKLVSDPPVPIPAASLLRIGSPRSAAGAPRLGAARDLRGGADGAPLLRHRRRSLRGGVHGRFDRRGPRGGPGRRRSRRAGGSRSCCAGSRHSPRSESFSLRPISSGARPC